MASSPPGPPSDPITGDLDPGNAASPSTSLTRATAVSVGAVLLAPWIIKIYTFRLHGQDRVAQEQVGAFFLRLLLPQMIFYAAGAVLTGLLNAHRRFAAPMFAPVLNNLIVMATF